MDGRVGTHARLFYHFVWTTKQRAPLIDADIENGLKSVLAAKAEGLDIKILEINGTEDHLHVLVKSRPSLAPSDIAKNLKGASSHFVNHVVLARDCIRSLYWQGGYGVVTVSPGAVRSVQQYIRHQKENHALNELIVDLENSAGSPDDENQTNWSGLETRSNGSDL